MKQKIKWTLFFILVGINGQAQTNTLSNSPYSLYGLGQLSTFSFGKTNGLGNTGIAMPTTSSINILNPASFTDIPANSFLFDLGFKAQKETLTTSGNSEPRFNANFSGLAFALPLGKDSGISLSLTPYSNVGYIVLNKITQVEGSTDQFITNIKGSGGLNDFSFSYAKAIGSKLRLGLKGTAFFGEIEEEETNIISSNAFNLNEKNFYNGFRLGLGMQYKITNKLSIGSTLQFPTSLNASQSETITVNGGEAQTNDEDLNSFKLPLEFGFGFHYKTNTGFLFNLDAKQEYWDSTNQKDGIGTFVDKTFIGIGMEYGSKKDPYKYTNRIKYRMGLNYDDGSLAISEQRIPNYSINFGLGLPFSRGTNSALNLSYSYGQRGIVSDGYIKENYHLLSLNVSLEGLWFVKRKVN